MLNGFIKRKKYAIKTPDSTKVEIPEGIYVKCTHCKKNIYMEDIKRNEWVCPYCQYHMPIGAKKRVKYIVDKGTFKELDATLQTKNILDFPNYEEKIEGYQRKTKQSEAIITGVGKINGQKTVIAVMDSHFMMGSMGCVVGEKITRSIEYATVHQLPIVIFAASGGARMQEGIFSLMQMAKTSAALAKHDEEGLCSIIVLTDPTTGGVTASFAMLGDIILAEPGVLVGFAGPRVIEQTINQKLPEGFQKAEFLLEHGMIDSIVDRKNLKNQLAKLLEWHSKEVQDER